MLLNAAAQMAAAGSSGDPEKVVREAASMAAGNPPKQGAARAMAVRGATDLVRRYGGGGGGGGAGGGSQNSDGWGKRPAAPAARRDPEPEPDPDPMDDGGGLTFADDDAPSLEGERFDDHGDAPGTAEEVSARAGAFDPTALTADQMKEMVVGWIRADPNRKGEVMNMVPELMREVT
jgi:hypothetical protein